MRSGWGGGALMGRLKFGAIPPPSVIYIITCFHCETQGSIEWIRGRSPIQALISDPDHVSFSMAAASGAVRPYSTPEDFITS